MSLHKFLDENEIHPYSDEGKLIGEAWGIKQNQIEQLQKQVEVLREACEFYAKNDSYRSKNGGHLENKNFKSLIGKDCGRKAMAALEKIKSIGGE